MDDFRRFFLRGLAALAPTLLTIAVIIWAYKFIERNLGSYVTQAMMRVCSAARDAPGEGWLSEDRFSFQPDSIKYGTKLNEWDDRGRRLTVEYKTIHHPLVYTAIKADPEGTAQEREKFAVIEQRNAALWRIMFVKYKLHLLGFLIAGVLVYFLGYFLASFVGRRMWRMAEGVASRVPLIRAIYPHIKQVTDFFLSEKKLKFSTVVAVEYPRRGLWSMGLVTGPPLKPIQRRFDEALVTVFIPSSPTPVTGYVIAVPKEELIYLDLSIDEVIRFAISGGVLNPSVPLPSDEDDDAGSDDGVGS